MHASITEQSFATCAYVSAGVLQGVVAKIARRRDLQSINALFVFVGSQTDMLTPDELDDTERILTHRDAQVHWRTVDCTFKTYPAAQRVLATPKGNQRGAAP